MELSLEAQALFADSLVEETPVVHAKPLVTGDNNKRVDLIEKFDKELVEWDKMIYKLAGMMKDIGRMVDVQSELYEQRHKLVDRKHKLLRTFFKFEKHYKKQYGLKLDHYATGYDRKLTAGERDKMAEADMTDVKYDMDILENHINQIDQIFKTVENMIFGIKHRLDLEDYLRKM